MSAPRSVAWSLGGQVAVTAASMLSTVILGRLLTPNDFGVFAFAVSIYSVIQWLLTLGLGQYVLREAELTPEKLDGAFVVCCLQGLAATIIIAILSPVAGWFGHEREIMWIMLSVAIIPLIGSPEAVADALWLRQGRYGAVAVLQVAKALVQSLVSIGVQWWLHWGAYSLAIGLVAGTAIGGLFSLISLIRRNKARFRISREQWMVLQRFGGRSFATTLALAASTRGPELLIGRELSIPILGHYNRASAALNTVAQVVSTAVARAASPIFYSSVNEGRPLREAVADLANLILFFVWPTLGGVAVLAAPLVHLLYGPQWDIAAQVLPILCLMAALDTARSGGQEVLLIRDRLGLNARIETVRAVYAIGLVFVAAHFGLMAAVWSRVADSAVTMVFYWLVMRRLEALPVARLAGILAMNGLLTVAAAGVPFYLMAHWHWPAQLSFGGYCAVIGSGVVSWIVVLLIVRHPYALRGIEMARNRLQPATA